MIDETSTMVDDLPEAEITSTDIVFDCPCCGHSLVVDYRAAGLQVPCVACGETITAPIPEGLTLDDLDRDSGELLQQLLQTRRVLMNTEMENRKLKADLAVKSSLLDAYCNAFRQIILRIELLQDSAELMNENRHALVSVIENLPKLED